MNRIHKLVQRLPGRKSRDQNAEVVLGLPLESSGVTIYPVYLGPGTHSENGTDHRQIGYLEICGERSDFVSLESDYRLPLLLAATSALVLTLAWFARRVMTGDHG